MGSSENSIELRGEENFFLGPIKMISNIRKRKNLVKNMISRDFKINYHGHILGYFWSLLEPLALTGIFFLVFIILRGGSDTLLPLKIMIGILIFNSFARTLNNCTSCLIQNSGLIQQVYFPREIFPVSIAGFRFANLFLSILIIIPYMVYEQIQPTGLMFLLPIAMISTVIFGQGLGMMAAIIQVKFRDLKQIVDLIVRAGFFLSGVFFGAEIIPEDKLDLFFYNPIAVFIEMSRAAVIGDMGVLSQPVIVRSIIVSMFTFYLGSAFFMKYERRAVKFL